jgi:non-ribosomal peptide synthetase component F
VSTTIARRVARLPLMSDAERLTLRSDVQRHRRAVPAGRFNCTRCSRRRPRRGPTPSLRLEERHLTYGELNARANQVAQPAARARRRPGRPVALCVERGLEMLVGMLGILKAGGAYVPLDPAYPPERLADMLADDGPVALLTLSTRGAPARPAPTCPRSGSTRAGASALDDEPAHDLAPAAVGSRRAISPT